MRGIKGLRIGLVGAAAIAVALIGGILLAGTVSAAAHGTVDVHDGSAAPGGLDGDNVLGSITFECAADEGSSALTISVNVFADATIGDPQDLNPSISDGTFDCEEAAAGDDVVAPPKVGTGPMSGSGNSLGWLVALLAVAGAAGLVTAYGSMRMRAR